MTALEVYEQALARATEFSTTVPTTESTALRRISVREQQLFSHANRLDPDYFGVCVVGVLEGGRLDLRDVVRPLDPIEAVTRITIADPGSSAYAVGEKVHVVTIYDPEVAEPPRVTIRNWILMAIGSDLDGVLKLRISYARRPNMTLATERQREIEVTDPFSELLVLDLAIWLLKKTLDLAPETRAAAIEVLSGEEAALLAAFEAHVRDFILPREARFGTVPYSERP